MDILERIAARIAAPKHFRITTTYASGVTKTRDVETMGQAENWATGERRKIGRDLIDRGTGDTVRVVSVNITGI